MVRKLFPIILCLIMSSSSFGGCNPILPGAGGSGVCNSNSNTITLGGPFSNQNSFSLLGNYPFTANLSASTNITFPVSGTLLTDIGSYSNPSWLTTLNGSKLTGTVTANAITAGTYGINITGNSGTVTNGVYTTDIGTVTNAMLAGSIADSKLNTISTTNKVANSATTATNSNTASTIVARDASGNFSAGTITANLNGNANTVTTNANLNGDVNSVGNTTTLATVNSSPGSYGDGTHVTSITVNGKGLVTSANSVAITGASPTGAAGGDLSGTYPNPTVAKINGNTLGSTTPTSGNALLGNGSSWVSTPIPTSINGTTNQIAASAATGAITLSVPQLLELSGSSPQLRYTNNSAVNNSTIGSLAWVGLDSAAAQVFYGNITNQIISNTSGAPRGKIFFNVQDSAGGTLTNYVTLDGSTGKINLLKTINIPSLSTTALVATNSSGDLTSTTSSISPQFAGMNLSALNASQLVGTDASKNLSSISTITAAQGGTGLDSSAWAQGDMPYISATGTWNHLAKNSSSTRYLSNTGTSNNPAWAQIDLTTGVTGILPGGNGGTNNGFMQFSGPATSTKTFTLPNASATILTTNSAVTEVQGGTNQTSYALGDTLYASATNTLSKLAGNTTTTRKFYRQTGNGSISAAPAWDTLQDSDLPGAALTKTDDTNVTLTLGGSPSTALLNAVSLTLGWTGQLGLTRGGTNASLTASNGGIFYSTASAGAILSGTATAGKILQSGASAPPSWSIPTYPSASGSAGKILRADGTNNIYSTATFADTYAANNILFASSSNAVSGLATANNGALVTNSSGVPSISSTLPTAVQDNITELGTLNSILQNSAQPFFTANVSSLQSNVTGAGVAYTVIFDTTTKNVGSSYNTTTGTFTAPVTGNYQFSGVVNVQNIGASNSNANLKIITTSATYLVGNNNPTATKDTANSTLSYPFSINIPLTSGDTVTVQIVVNGGTQTVGVRGASPNSSWFSGYLVS